MNNVKVQQIFLVSLKVTISGFKKHTFLCSFKSDGAGNLNGLEGKAFEV
jgi:hypothetical protein